MSHCQKTIISYAGKITVDLYCSQLWHPFLIKDIMIRLEPIILKNLPIIPSQTSQKFYPLFLIYSQIITYYSFIILLILLNQ